MKKSHYLRQNVVHLVRSLRVLVTQHPQQLDNLDLPTDESGTGPNTLVLAIERVLRAAKDVRRSGGTRACCSDETASSRWPHEV